MKSSSGWSLYSMLKSTLNIYENVNICNYKRLSALLKRKNDDYKPKKSKTLNMEDIEKFLDTAADQIYLMIKVVLIFALNSACRMVELYNLMTKDITDNGTVAIINLRNTKTEKDRFFSVTNDCNGYQLYKRYFNMRPHDIKHDSYFIFYQNLSCTSHKVGINTFRKIPNIIADFLKLPESNLYSGHCLRRTSATLLADSGVNVQILKRHGGWRSSSTAESYIDESVEHKIRTSKKVFQYASTATSINNDDKENKSTLDNTHDLPTTTDNKIDMKLHFDFHNTHDLPTATDNNIDMKAHFDFNKTSFVNVSNNNCTVNIYNTIEK